MTVNAEDYDGPNTVVAVDSQPCSHVSAANVRFFFSLSKHENHSVSARTAPGVSLGSGVPSGPVVHTVFVKPYPFCKR